MDHNMMSMTSASMSMLPTGTAAMAMPSSTGAAMSMGMGSNCKISMLWNWYTVDSCFISKTWRNTSKGMFAGSCIGVILLVVALEFLRRAGKEYDRFIVAQYAKTLSPSNHVGSSASSDVDHHKDPGTTSTATAARSSSAAQRFRPSIVQQTIRALLHMLQFAVAYFVMLLAMYYNGYIIICIFIGAFIGYFIFGYETLAVSQDGQDRLQPNATVCCG